MLYTVTPLERIFARPESYSDIRQERPVEKAEEEYHDINLKHGRVVTRRNGENYIVERINSTDMTDYLKEEYSPGKTIQG